MYVDFGRQRGRVHFTWRDLIVIGTLISSGVGYVLRTELALGQVRAELSACRDSVRQLQRAQVQPGGALSTERSVQ